MQKTQTLEFNHKFKKTWDVLWIADSDWQPQQECASLSDID